MAPINPPWRFDPFQMPVNVNWGGAMAVIYGGSGGSFHVIDQSGNILWTNGPPPPYSDPHQGNDFGAILSAMTPTLRGDNTNGGEEPVVVVCGTRDADANLPRVVCYDSRGNMKWIQDFPGFPAADTSSTSNGIVYGDCDTDGNIAIMLEIFTAGGDQWEYIGKLKGKDGTVIFAQDWASNHLVDLANGTFATPGNIQDSDIVRCTPDGTIALTVGTFAMIDDYATAAGVQILCYDGRSGAFKGRSYNPATIGSNPGNTFGAPFMYTFNNTTRGFAALQNNTFIILNDLRMQGLGPHHDPTWPGWPDVFPYMYQTADEWYYIEAYDTSGNRLSQTTFYSSHQEFWFDSISTSGWRPPAAVPIDYTPGSWEGRSDSSFWASHTLPPATGVDNIAPFIDLFSPTGDGPLQSFDVPVFNAILEGGGIEPCQITSISMTFDAPAITYPVTDVVVQYKADGTINWQIGYPYVGNVGGTSPGEPIGLVMSPRPMKPLGHS